MQTFTKAERLCSKVLIEELIGGGQTFNTPPFRVTWKKKENLPARIQVLISVPKKNHKKAVDRNRIKRLTREVYRKNKAWIYTELKNEHLLLMLMYTSKTIPVYAEVEEKIIKSLQRLLAEINLHKE
jgi:ribonuclease P protein component